MEEKAYPSQTVSIEDERTVTGIAAVFGVIDAGADRVHKGAFLKTIRENLHRVKHLWQHDRSAPPIASILEVREVGKGELPDEIKSMYPEARGGLLVKRRYLDTQRANEVLAGILADPPAITEMSFAYDPMQFDFTEEETADGKMLVRNLKQVRLWETSDVIWGMNTATRARVKAVVPYRDTGRLPDDTEWSAPALSDFTDDDFAELSAAERERIMEHFTWSANRPPEAYADLKLPHHAPSKNGVGKAVWRGVAAAMAALMGARGGVDIPVGERRGVYDHLVRHYEEFGKEAPDYKLLEMSWCMADAASMLEDNSVLKQRIHELQRLLTAEPRQYAALTDNQRKLMMRYELLARQIELLRL